MSENGTLEMFKSYAIKDFDDKNIPYSIIDAEENEELCDEYGIMQAPTLVVIEEDGSFQTYANASNIIRYLNS